MPARPAAMAAPIARYGLPEASTGFSSTFAPRGRVLREPWMSRNGASRFSRPQQR